MDKIRTHKCIGKGCDYCKEVKKLKTKTIKLELNKQKLEAIKTLIDFHSGTFDDGDLDRAVDGLSGDVEQALELINCPVCYGHRQYRCGCK